MNDSLKKMCDENNVDLDSGNQFLQSLKRHIAYVQEAGKKLNVPQWQLDIHDESKYSKWEFPHYAQRFFGTKDNDRNFDMALIHHYGHNPHHCEYWLVPEAIYAVRFVKMKDTYVSEMVSNWMGANREHKQTWDMSEWIVKTFHNIPIHWQSRKLAIEILHGIGYSFDFQDGNIIKNMDYSGEL